MTRNRVVPVPTLRCIVRAATQAPSVHNTQPWRWRASSSSLELLADRSRLLSMTDPDGRNLTISCGAALHHAQTAATALGWAVSVTRLPDPAAPDLLAHLDLSPATAAAHGRELLDAVEQRCTDRRRFTSWPVPDERLAHLAGLASAWGTTARALTDATERFHAERLMVQAAAQQARDRAAVVERDQWVDRGAVDGIPRAALTGSGVVAGAFAHRFETDPVRGLEGQDVQQGDGLVLLVGGHDDPASWLVAGEGLSAMWLAATVEGLSIVPLSQVIEVEQTREALRRDVLRDLGHPLLLVRVGWQAIGRSELTRTPRRPLDDVLEEA
jgi:nitroreductase